MTPNPKEALERIVAICTTDQHSEGVAVGRVLEAAQAALATKPDGERLKEIAKIIDPLAAELRTALDNAEGEPPELRLEAEAKWKARNDAALTKADLILVSGLVQDEAGWRDISTAPKDHFPILTWSEHGGRCVAFRDVAWKWWPCPPTRPLVSKPTHWMPLPAPPIRFARDGCGS